MQSGLVIWFLTLHGVNTAMYLAVTRVAYGWTKTLLGLLVFYAALAVPVVLVRLADVSPANFTPFGFPLGFGVWLAVAVSLSHRGSRSVAFFESVLCGAHQLAVSGLCYVLMARVRPEGLATILASALLLAMGAGMIVLLLPRVRRLSPSVDWRLLNAVVFILLTLVYVTGIWPTWVAGGSWREALPFVVSVTALVSFFPMVFHLSEKSHAAARVTQVEGSVRLMVEEVRLRREAIDAARRQRHDSRHHRIVIAEHLLRGQVDRALDYLERLDQEADRTLTDRLIWCENDTINAILSGLSRKAAAKGVAFEVTANVGRTVDLPDVDIVAVVANLVENAINAAAEPATSGDDPKVTVALRQRERTVGMTVTNPVPAGFALSENGLPCAESGVGLESARQVIERHRGELVYTSRGGVLECQAMMRIENEHSSL